MTDQEKRKLIANMTDNLPMLRKKLEYSQDKLAHMAGVSRSTIANIENGRIAMSWNMFLSLLMIFIKHNETDKLLNILEIYTDDFNQFIKH